MRFVRSARKSGARSGAEELPGGLLVSVLHAGVLQKRDLRGKHGMMPAVNRGEQEM